MDLYDPLFTLGIIFFERLNSYSIAILSHIGEEEFYHCFFGSP